MSENSRQGFPRKFRYFVVNNAINSYPCSSTTGTWSNPSLLNTSRVSFIVTSGSTVIGGCKFRALTCRFHHLVQTESNQSNHLDVPFSYSGQSIHFLPFEPQGGLHLNNLHRSPLYEAKFQISKV